MDGTGFDLSYTEIEYPCLQDFVEDERYYPIYSLSFVLPTRHGSPSDVRTIPPGPRVGSPQTWVRTTHFSGSSGSKNISRTSHFVRIIYKQLTYFRRDRVN